MTKNVIELYNTCARLIDAAEAQGNAIDQEILDALEKAFNEIIEFEELFLIKCQDKFYGSILMDLDVEIDFKQRGPVDLKINRSPLAIGVNPLWCGKYKFSEFTGLIVNEITKMIYLHPAEFSKINPEKDSRKHKLLDDASSAASSSIVKRDIRLTPEIEGMSSAASNGCRLPESVFTTTQLNKDCGVRSSEEMPLSYYYEILQKYSKNNPADGSGSSKNGNGNSQNQSNQTGNSQGQSNQTNCSGGGQKNTEASSRTNSNGNDTHDWEGGDSDELKEQITSVISDVYNSLSSTARGFIPSSIMSQIKSLLAPPEIDWKAVFRKMIGSIPSKHRKTRTRLNRRQPFRADLSGRLPKRICNVVCCFDTSGSMSNDDLMYCANEVFNIVKIRDGAKITIIECDAEIQKVYEAKKITEVQLSMKGRGGTSFVPVIEFINGEGKYSDPKKYPKAGKFRDAVMVYFTDGYGDAEIPRPRTYRNLWVVLDSEKNLSLKEPYGEVKSLSKDADWKKRKGLK